MIIGYLNELFKASLASNGLPGIWTLSWSKPEAHRPKAAQYMLLTQCHQPWSQL